MIERSSRMIGLYARMKFPRSSPNYILALIITRKGGDELAPSCLINEIERLEC